MKTLSQIALSHFSPEVVRAVRSELPGDGEEWDVFDPEQTKPRGFWVSLDGENDWAQLSRRLGRAPGIRHRVVLRNDGNLLIIDDEADAREVSRWYMRQDSETGGLKIDWKAMGADWAGILMLRFDWPLTLEQELYWTHHWSIPSGCIWDSRAIGSIEPVSAPDGA